MYGAMPGYVVGAFRCQVCATISPDATDIVLQYTPYFVLCHFRPLGNWCRLARSASHPCPTISLKAPYTMYILERAGWGEAP